MRISSFFVFLTIFQLLSADKADDQLPNWRDTHQGFKRRATDQLCRPHRTLSASLSVGRKGPVLLQDTNFLDKITHFDRERIPERVVHAKGCGAYGKFEVTHDISKLTKANVFQPGQMTEVFVRFSTSTGERGSADTDVDLRGMAVKFYTVEGVYDLTCLNIKNFPIRDPILFPDLVHSVKNNPRTNLFDNNMLWDFASQRQESIFAIMNVFSTVGLPSSFRKNVFFAGHAFRFVNSYGEYNFVKFHLISNQGVGHFTLEEAAKIRALDPDYYVRDLFNAIENGQYPSWTLNIQIMTPKEAKLYRWDPFDLTKVWLETDFPLMPVGKLTLNRNPLNFFEEVEQSAFSPGNLVPGIEISPDKILQGRVFSYPDTQRHRVGPNFAQLPVNKPKANCPVATYFQHGAHADINPIVLKDEPNFSPNSFNGPKVDPRFKESTFWSSGLVDRHDTGDDDNWSQAQLFWNQIMSQVDKDFMIRNMALTLIQVDSQVKANALMALNNVSPQIVQLIKEQWTIIASQGQIQNSTIGTAENTYTHNQYNY